MAFRLRGGGSVFRPVLRERGAAEAQPRGTTAKCYLKDGGAGFVPYDATHQRTLQF